MLLKLIDKFYDSIENENYGLSQRIAKNIANYTIYYIDKKGKKSKIDEYKKTMAEMFSDETRKLKRQNKHDEYQKVVSESIQAMYDIVETINMIFPELGCYVMTYIESDPVKKSGEMD